MVNFFSPNTWQMMTFRNPLDTQIPKIPFSFFAEFWFWVTSGAPGSVSVGFWGARQLSPFGGGGVLARGLYRPPPPPGKRQPGCPWPNAAEDVCLCLARVQSAVPRSLTLLFLHQDTLTPHSDERGREEGAFDVLHVQRIGRGDLAGAERAQGKVGNGWRYQWTTNPPFPGMSTSKGSCGGVRAPVPPFRPRCAAGGAIRTVTVWSNRRRLPSNRRRLPSNRRRLPPNRRRLPSNRRRLPVCSHFLSHCVVHVSLCKGA